MNETCGNVMDDRGLPLFLGTVNRSKLISGLNNSTTRPPPRLHSDSAAIPRGDLATSLVAGDATAGVVAAAVLRPVVGTANPLAEAKDSISNAVYVSEQVCKE